MSQGGGNCSLYIVKVWNREIGKGIRGTRETPKGKENAMQAVSVRISQSGQRVKHNIAYLHDIWGQGW